MSDLQREPSIISHYSFTTDSNSFGVRFDVRSHWFTLRSARLCLLVNIDTLIKVSQGCYHDKNPARDTGIHQR